MCTGHQVALDDKIYHGMGILKGLIQDIGSFFTYKIWLFYEKHLYFERSIL